ncbi:CCR4-Not complex component [Naegleria gruberi]|uniref:CCR4-Not complex component n=1 Tax=Naegleria gruberi TaxID=5762 RepID=D2V2Z7_NAEGR|nr:CCR4-Not complex component [Naegleria gruberi]EFC48539.1 CCR4-Not complex component [Naegleria gruberi]|eukprot:XP_002681283.1 CCR4-Not complex component [Naegleria gruberi strain NEG-M]
MSTTDIFNKLTLQFPHLTEQDVGELIGMMVMNHTGLQARTEIPSFMQSIGIAKYDFKENVSSWNLDNFVSVMKNKDLNWKQVVACLDYPNFKFRDQKGLSMVVTLYKKLTGEKLPLDVFVCRKWNNTEAQLSFILLALDAPPDIIDFTSDKLRHVDISFLPSHKNQNTTWGTIDLIETLINLADNENIVAIRKVFEAPIKQCPEQFLLALAQSKPTNAFLQQEFISQIVPIFVKPHKNSFPVLHKLCEVNQSLLIASLSDSYRKDATQLRRILDIAQELKILDAILESRPFRFAIEIAVLASKRDHLNLELWLLNNLERYTSEFAQEVISYLTDGITSWKEKNSQSSFTVDSAKIIFKCLDKARSIIVNEVLEQAYQVYQTLDDSIKKEISSSEFQLSPEVEQKTNQFFLSMFRAEITVEAGIEKLKDLKLSKSKADQEMFACVIHNLFDEYRFFNLYPDDVLGVMAKLYGYIIQHNIIVAKTLKYGLICVLTALSSTEVKMFQFGLIALSLFKTRVSEWPQFCAHLRTKVPQVFTHIPDLAQHAAKGFSMVDSMLPTDQMTIQSPTLPPTSLSPQPMIQPNTGMSSPLNAGYSQMPISPPVSASQAGISMTSSPPPPVQQPTKEDPQTPTKIKKEEEKDRASPGIGFQLDISTLTNHANTQEIEKPDNDTADKIFFVINNLSLTNMDKCAELKQLLAPNLYPYFSRYIVVNRASLEPNFHAVYSKMLATLQIESLDKCILKQTYEAISALLDSERITTSLSERSLLKNLGSWLGLHTVAKNKPVLQKDLDIKTLLFNAYEKGRLIAVIPFVCKILNNCSKSKVFVPPNPWVMGIVSLLVEIHSIPELKLNLKFEVEMLCKTLKLTLSQVEQQNKEKGVQLLAGKVQVKKNNPDINAQTGAEQPTTNAPTTVPTTTGTTSTNKAEKLFNILKISDASVVIADLQDQVKISDSLTIFKDQPELRKLVVIALDQTIREIIAPVVKRAVTISCRTTGELIIKDFIAEPDYQKLARSANLMVSNLAAKLAKVSCKDLLKSSLQGHLKRLLETACINPTEKVKTLIEQVVNVVSNDNINVGTAYVEQAARDKSMIDVAETLQSEIELRKGHQNGAIGPWTNYTMPPAIQRLPDLLAPKNGLHRNHLQVYEDFERKIHSEKPREDMLPINVAIDQGKVTLAKIFDFINQAKKQVPSLLFIPPQSELYTNIAKLRSVLTQSVQGGETAEELVSDLFNKLYENDLPIVKETCVLLMMIIRDMESESSIQQVTNLWKGMKNQQKLEKDITTALIRADLLDLPSVDNELVSLLADQSCANLTLSLLLHLIQKLVSHKSTIMLNDLPKCSSFIQNHLKNLPESNHIALMLDQALKTATALPENTLTIMFNASSDFESQDRFMMRDQLTKKLLAWVHLFDAPVNPGFLGIDLRSTSASLYQLINENKEILLAELKEISKNDKFFEELILNMLQITLEYYYKCITPVPGQQQFKFADAFSELIGNLIFGESYRAKIVTRFHITLTTIKQFIIRDHDLQQTNFNQRIYLRLLSNLLTQINTFLPQPVIQSADYQIDERIIELNVELLSAFADALSELEPSAYPGFVFGWLDLIAHRHFMPKLLSPVGKKGMPKFHALVMHLFKFLEPYLRNISLSNPVKLVYRASLKILLVLLHDFPEFLCDYHFSLCNVIPSTCIQMRNLILSAFPRHMKLPDPFTQNLKVDLLPEINEPPNILSDYMSYFTKDLNADILDSFVLTRDVNILNQLSAKLKLSPQEAEEVGTAYNVPLINAIVIYTGIIATRQQSNPVINTPATDILRKLIFELDSEGRYLVLNSLANQLRYPNIHTHFFSCVILNLFLETVDKEFIQEQITRVLIERLIASRPHPWGLLITFIELVKNSRYKFWEKPFIHCSGDIDTMFQNVRFSL